MRRFQAAFVMLAFPLVVGSCSHESIGPTQDDAQTDFVVSNSVLSSSIPRTSTAAQLTQAQRFSYVSAPPGSFPTGKVVTIGNVTKQTVAPSAFIVNGGFDPVAVEADEGDDIRLSVLLADGTKLVNTLTVPPRKPPIVVRTQPTKGRIDVALNVVISVVFSEPINSQTITSQSIQLLQSGTRVAGSVVVDANSWTVEFTPSNQLSPNRTYELVVTSDVRDLDGDAVESSYVASFTTTNAPAPAVPGSIVGTVFEQTATGPKPVPFATIYPWVEGGSESFNQSFGATPADGEGKFTLKLPPGVTVTLTAAASGYDQPCFKIFSYNGGSMTTDVELVPRSHPLTAANDPVVVTGIVYETTPSGKQPVAGATLYVDRFDDHNFAWTITDENGRYKFCALAPWMNFGPQIYAGKDGFEWSYNLLKLTGSEQSVTLDIELKH